MQLTKEARDNYKKKIMETMSELEDDRFIIQIYTIIMSHIRKRGC